MYRCVKVEAERDFGAKKVSVVATLHVRSSADWFQYWKPLLYLCCMPYCESLVNDTARNSTCKSNNEMLERRLWCEKSLNRGHFTRELFTGPVSIVVTYV